MAPKGHRLGREQVISALGALYCGRWLQLTPATRSCLAEYQGDPRIEDPIDVLPTATSREPPTTRWRSPPASSWRCSTNDDELTAGRAGGDGDCNQRRRGPWTSSYSDEDKLTPGGVRCDPFFKPDWSPEHFSRSDVHLPSDDGPDVTGAEVQGFRTGVGGYSATTTCGCE